MKLYVFIRKQKWNLKIVVWELGWRYIEWVFFIFQLEGKTSKQNISRRTESRISIKSFNLTFTFVIEWDDEAEIKENRNFSRLFSMRFHMNWKFFFGLLLDFCSTLALPKSRLCRFIFLPEMRGKSLFFLPLHAETNSYLWNKIFCPRSKSFRLLLW